MVDCVPCFKIRQSSCDPQHSLTPASRTRLEFSQKLGPLKLAQARLDFIDVGERVRSHLRATHSPKLDGALHVFSDGRGNYVLSNDYNSKPGGDFQEIQADR